MAAVAAVGWLAVTTTHCCCMVHKLVAAQGAVVVSASCSWVNSGRSSVQGCSTAASNTWWLAAPVLLLLVLLLVGLLALYSTSHIEEKAVYNLPMQSCDCCINNARILKLAKRKILQQHRAHGCMYVCVCVRGARPCHEHG